VNGVLRSLASGFGHGVHRSVGVVIPEDGGTMVESKRRWRHRRLLVL